MSYSRVIKDSATPFLKELAEKLGPRKFADQVGQAVANVVRSHLALLPPNKRGWPTTKFYKRAVGSVHHTTVNDGAVVGIKQIGFAQRVEGGPIKPVNAKALTIPISPVSYGHTAKDFPRLFVLKTHRGAYLVQPGDEAVAEKTKKGFSKAAKGLGGNWKRRVRKRLYFLFRLSKGVVQQPDPSVLPTDEQFFAGMRVELEQMLPPK